MKTIEVKFAPGDFAVWAPHGLPARSQEFVVIEGVQIKKGAGASYILRKPGGEVLQYGRTPDPMVVEEGDLFELQAFRRLNREALKSAIRENDEWCEATLADLRAEIFETTKGAEDRKEKESGGGPAR